MAPARERHPGAQHGPGGDAMSDRKAACEGGKRWLAIRCWSTGARTAEIPGCAGCGPAACVSTMPAHACSSALGSRYRDDRRGRDYAAGRAGAGDGLPTLHAAAEPGCSAEPVAAVRSRWSGTPRVRRGLSSSGRHRGGRLASRGELLELWAAVRVSCSGGE